MDLLKPSDRIYVAGHQGLVGSAIWRALQTGGYSNLIGEASSALDLRDLLLATRGPRHSQATRDEEVAAVAVLDSDDIPRDAETIDGLSEDDLHLYLAELV